MEFAGHDITERSRLPLKRPAEPFRPYTDHAYPVDAARPEAPSPHSGSRRTWTARLDVRNQSSAGRHRADTEALLFDRLETPVDSLFVPEHDLDIIRHADCHPDVGPRARLQVTDRDRSIADVLGMTVDIAHAVMPWSRSDYEGNAMRLYLPGILAAQRPDM